MTEELETSDPESVGPYRLLQRLGTGGMGQVYLARSPGGRLVAVKVIRPELAAERGFRARFAREVAAARTVSGVFTAPVIDADPDGATPWLATGYVAGPSLADAVESRGPLSAEFVLALAAGLAEGLQAIHAAGVVHRDLKPSNVLLADDGPRVIDFGISRAVEASMLTQTGTVMGSPGFLSPEQAEGNMVGPPGDVFSLGAVLAFAATGEGPFGTGPAAALIYRVVNSEPNLSRVPPQLQPLVRRCLAKRPGERPTTGDLLAYLGDSRAGQPTAGWLPASLAAAAPGAAGLSAAPDAAGREYFAPTQTRATPTPARPPADVGVPTEPSGLARRPMRQGNRRRIALAAAATVALSGAAAGITIAVAGVGHATARPSASPLPASVRTSTTASASPPRTPTATAKPPSRPAGPAVAGTWTGTFVCNQGLTGMRLTIKGAGGDRLTATLEFYAVASNPGVPDGSYVLTGDYSGASMVLAPDYWISQPSGYVMVGFTALTRDNAMNGTVQGPNCSTFSATR